MGFSTFALPAIIAHIVGGEAADWTEADGPDSGVGVDYWYVREADDEQIYVNLDQEILSFSGDLLENEVTFNLEEPEDEWLAEYVSRFPAP